MKKFLFCVCLCVFMLSIKAKCATSSDIANLQSEYQTKFGYSLNANNAAQIIDKWQSLGVEYLMLSYSENQYHPNQLPYSYTKAQFVSTYSDTGTAYQWTSSTTSQEFNSSTSTTLNWSAGGSVSMNKNIIIKLKWSDFHTVPINWDNPQYNPNMPIPEFTTNYNDITVNSSSPEVPFDITINNGNNDYYIEIFCNYWIPDNMSIQVMPRGYNDGYVYKSLSKELVSDYLIDPEQMLRISGINNLMLQLQTDWDDALDQVPTSGIEYANPNSLPSGMFTQYKNTYENYCRRILGFYGSQFTIMMRYFSIVNETDYVVGAWRTWTTYSPNEFTDRMPDYYVPYVPASGEENITNDTDPENIQIVPGVGTSTGVVSDPNYYITVNQSVPNYPDYPTVRSYNADNFLIKTMNYLDYLDDPDTSNDLFGEFGKFCQSVFVFIPGEIWTIIAVGFCLVIVVMFLKIL